MLKIKRVFTFEGVDIDVPSHLEVAQFNEALHASENVDSRALPAVVALLEGRIHGHELDELPSLWLIRAAIALSSYRVNGDLEKKPVPTP